MDLSVFIVGFATTLIWWAGAALAYWRKRSMLFAGLTLAGAVGLVITFANAGAGVPTWLLDLSLILRGPVAALLVASFIAHQPKHAPRPDRWTQ